VTVGSESGKELETGAVYVDGTNLLVGTKFVREPQSRVLPWYKPSEGVAPRNSEKSWERLLSRLQACVDDGASVECLLQESRIPAFGHDFAETMRSHSIQGMLFSKRGLHKEPAKLYSLEFLPLEGRFPVIGALGVPIHDSDGKNVALAYGLNRYFVAHGKNHAYEGANQKLAQLCMDASHLLYDLPKEFATELWRNWPDGFSKQQNSDGSLWLDALFELSWRTEPGTHLHSRRYSSENNVSIGLKGAELFPRYPEPLKPDRLNTEGGYPLAWHSNLDDLAQASVSAIEIILGWREIPRHCSTKNITRGQLMKRDKVFISYSHKDKKFKDELLAHLKPLERLGRISSWSDAQIQPGSAWLSEIRTALAQASVAVLLVTKDFLASEFIHTEELAPLLKDAEAGGVTILWILVRDCSWQITPIQKYQAAFPPAKALATMKAERDGAWVEICKVIERATKKETS
jgi:hypothetical protein